MKNEYYIVEDLEELEQIHDELVSKGLSHDAITVWSEDNAEVDNRHLKQEPEFNKSDLIPSLMKGSVFGALATVTGFSLAFAFGLNNSVAFGPVAIFLVLLGAFITWESGLIGFHKINRHFKHLALELHRHKHLLHLRYEPLLSAKVNSVLARHPRMKVVHAAL